MCMGKNSVELLAEDMRESFTRKVNWKKLSSMHTLETDSGLWTLLFFLCVRTRHNYI